MKRIAVRLILICWIPVIAVSTSAREIPRSLRSQNAIARNTPALKSQLAKQQLTYGTPVFIRIFKDPGILELWLKNQHATFTLFKTYRICTFSGALGPKLRVGDQQSPEGFYFVPPNRLNPWSRFHLSFNLGYPNRYDRYHGRTGSALMVHGNCVSIGCYAMTDRRIEEIYTLVNAALENGQPFFRVHVFPFALTADNLARHGNHRWHAFWTNLRTGYDYFETHKTPPNVEVVNGRYVFGPQRGD